MEWVPKIVQAVAGDNFTVYLYFDDGRVRLYDAAPLIKKGGVFAPLQEAGFFKERLTVLNDTLAWDMSGNMDPEKCIDIDPCELYETCAVIEDPLRAIS